MARTPKQKPAMAKQLFKKRQDKAAPPIVDVRNVKKTYTSAKVPVKALDGVSLKVERGEMLAIMGPSGSGKSTLLNMIGLLDKPDDGKLEIDGQDAASLRRRKLAQFRQQEVGIIFQSKNLLPALTAFENVYLPFRYTRGKRALKQEQAAEALRLVGLVDRKDHLPAQLSGGEQQRVAVARALVLNPAIVLADEPTGELDSKTGHQIVELMQQLNTSTNQTFIIVTHNDLVAAACHRVVRMQDGKIDETKPPRRSKA